ncbi:11585_t:CDS:1, partial [Racocetra fulgida]
KSKSRCKKVEPFDQSTKCRKCIKHNLECTYDFQPQKRGPKGPKRRKRPPKNRKPFTSPPTPPPTFLPTFLPRFSSTSPHTSFATSLLTPPFTPPFTPPPSNVFVNNEELYELILDLIPEGIKSETNIQDSLHNEKNILDKLFTNENSSFILNTLTSTSASPCQYKNIA